MKKFAPVSEKPLKKPESFWKVVGRRLLAALCLSIALFVAFAVLVGCSGLQGVPAEMRLYQMSELSCWSDGRTFTCVTPEGKFTMNHWFVVGKGLWDERKRTLNMCAEELSH